MNVVTLTGRLTKDPVIRQTQSGSSVGDFTIAVNRDFKREGSPDVDFVPVRVFGKTAEFAGKWLRKGVKIEAVGRLVVDNYKDRDGNTKIYTYVAANTAGFAESKRANDLANEEEPVTFEEVSTIDSDEDLPF